MGLSGGPVQMWRQGARCFIAEWGTGADGIMASGCGGRRLRGGGRRDVFWARLVHHTPRWPRRWVCRNQETYASWTEP